MPNDIDKKRLKDFYNSVDNVWECDPWHIYSREILQNFLDNSYLAEDSIILNAGSAGNDYGLKCKKMMHVDIAEDKLKNIDDSVIASIENLPFESGIFDVIVCVGSVLNYCDAIAALSELYRVLKNGGIMIVEFENSNGYEYYGKKEYKQDAILTEIIYMDSSHQQWLYSYEYIIEILLSLKLEITTQYPFHISDGLLSRFMCDAKAVSFGKEIDKFIKHIPYIKRHGNNYILQCRKCL